MTKAPKPPPLPLPFVDMLTGDEIKEALVRLALHRKGITLSGDVMSLVDGEVSYRNVRLPDGSVSLFASVGVFRRPFETKATETPKPETNDG